MEIRPGTLEFRILDAAITAATDGDREFHAYGMATRISGGDRRSSLIGHGTLYKAMYRLEAAGRLVSRLEDPAAAEKERRPRRRLYSVTIEGARQMSVVSSLGRLSSDRSTA